MHFCHNMIRKRFSLPLESLLLAVDSYGPILYVVRDDTSTVVPQEKQQGRAPAGESGALRRDVRLQPKPPGRYVSQLRSRSLGCRGGTCQPCVHACVRVFKIALFIKAEYCKKF